MEVSQLCTKCRIPISPAWELLSVPKYQHATELNLHSSGLGASPNNPGIIVLLEADPNPRKVNWDILKREAASYESGHQGRLLQIFPVIIYRGQINGQ